MHQLVMCTSLHLSLWPQKLGAQCCCAGLVMQSWHTGSVSAPAAPGRAAWAAPQCHWSSSQSGGTAPGAAAALLLWGLQPPPAWPCVVVPPCVLHPGREDGWALQCCLAGSLLNMRLLLVLLCHRQLGRQQCCDAGWWCGLLRRAVPWAAVVALKLHGLSSQAGLLELHA